MVFVLFYMIAVHVRNLPPETGDDHDEDSARARIKEHIVIHYISGTTIRHVEVDGWQRIQ